MYQTIGLASTVATMLQYIFVKGLIDNNDIERPNSKCINHEATALQRQNTEISKQIIPEKEYWGLSPNFHSHVSVRDL